LTPAFFNCARNSSISSGCGTDKHNHIAAMGHHLYGCKTINFLNMLIENGWTDRDAV